MSHNTEECVGSVSHLQGSPILVSLSNPTVWECHWHSDKYEGVVFYCVGQKSNGMIIHGIITYTVI